MGFALNFLPWLALAIVVVSVGVGIYKGWATFLGVVSGAILGFLAAGGAALLYVSAAEEGCIDPECGIFGALIAFVVAVTGAALGAVVGGLIGRGASRRRHRNRAIGFGEPDT